MLRSTRNVLVLLGFATFAAMYSGGAAAQYYSSSGAGLGDRAQQWEFWGEARFIFGTTLNFQGGSSVSTSTDAGFGLGFGYNIDEHWLTSFEFQYNEMSYSALIASGNTPPQKSASVTGDAQISRIGASITYNLLARPFTPYALANIGWTYVDSNIPNGPPQTGCWWDPWFGYICSTWQSTHSSSGFSYGLGVGLRWDVGHSFFMRAGYEYDWVDLPHSSNSAFNVLRLQFGTRY